MPAPIERVQKVDVENIREINLGSASEETLMLTGDQNIIDIAYQVRWNIRDPELYLFELAQPEDTIKQVAESAMRQIVGNVSLQGAMGNQRGIIEGLVAQEMQQTLDAYRAGVDIQGVAIRQADPPAAVNDAFKEVTAAQQEAESYVNQATAYALQLRQKAQGEAGAFDRIYVQYKAAPEVTKRRMYYETMERVLQEVDKTILEAPGVNSYLPLNELRRSPREGAGPMTDFVRRHPMMAGLMALFILFLVTSTFAIVPETRQGIVVRFGKPVRIINRYEPGQQFGSAGAGIAWRIPLRRERRLARQARARHRHGAPAGALDRPAPARGRRLRPIPDRRPAAHVHRRAHRGPGRERAAADPRFAAAQRARQEALRLAPQSRSARG